jgi:hypothetical protein
MNGHFKSLSQINSAPVPIVLSADTPTQMEPSFISEKCKLFGQKLRHTLPTKTRCKNALFACNCLLQLLESVLILQPWFAKH